MEWVQSASQWVKATFDSVGLGPMAFPLALLLGLLSAVASVCCTLPVLGAIVAYSGTRQASDRRTNFLTAAFLMLGTILALIILGSVAGYVGQVAQASLARASTASWPPTPSAPPGAPSGLT